MCRLRHISHKREEPSTRYSQRIHGLRSGQELRHEVGGMQVIRGSNLAFDGRPGGAALRSNGEHGGGVAAKGGLALIHRSAESSKPLIDALFEVDRCI